MEQLERLERVGSKLWSLDPSEHPKNPLSPWDGNSFPERKILSPPNVNQFPETKDKKFLFCSVLYSALWPPLDEVTTQKIKSKKSLSPKSGNSFPETGIDSQIPHLEHLERLERLERVGSKLWSLDPSEHRDFKCKDNSVIGHVTFIIIHFKIINQSKDFTPMVLTSLKNIFWHPL